VRVFVPAFLFLIVLLNLPRWLQSLKKPKQLLSLIVFAIGFAAIFGPLAWQHIFHPEGVNRHFLFQPQRLGTVTLYEFAGNSLVRYLQHFTPDFLCAPVDFLSPPDKGMIEWYMVALLVVGIITIISKLRVSMPARIVLAFVLAYPAGDCLVWAQIISSLRSFVGLCGLILLAAVGGVNAFEWLWKKNKNLGRFVTGAFLVIMLISSASYFRSFFGYFQKSNEKVYHKMNTDLVDACVWLKPRLNDFDAVIFSPIGITHIIAVVTLSYDPVKWLSEPREYYTSGEWDYYTRFGKIYVTPDAFSNPDLKYRPGHILIIIQPGEVTLEGIENNIIHKIIGPNGQEKLWLCLI
jgi:hypothetical protein